MVSTLEHMRCACPTFQIACKGWTQEEPKQVLWRKQTPSSNTRATRPSQLWFWNPTTPTNSNPKMPHAGAANSLLSKASQNCQWIWKTSFIITTHRMRAAYMNVFSLPNFVILRLTALFAIGWSFTFTLRPKKLIGTNFHNYTTTQQFTIAGNPT